MTANGSSERSLVGAKPEHGASVSPRRHDETEVAGAALSAQGFNDQLGRGRSRILLLPGHEASIAHGMGAETV